ncbi:hypothetical protein [Pantoea ananatis]|uniref:hypothetical protein n=1 Tax=Pantoea ananas TaxID=553 RepID=UPI001B317110|nr:hypothetical protein [Pantoea ananatis]MCW1833555.1 hypothetical protein [Pantoea ananatis]
MSLLTKNDLQFDYSWTAIPPDDARITGFPDNTLLNRHEGYEVLAFINRMAKASKWEAKLSGLKTERMIRDHLPGDIRSHRSVWKWIVENWSSYK